MRLYDHDHIIFSIRKHSILTVIELFQGVPNDVICDDVRRQKDPNYSRPVTSYSRGLGQWVPSKAPHKEIDVRYLLNGGHI